MPKGYKKRNMKARNEKNLQKRYYNNGPMYQGSMNNAQNFGNSQYFNNYVPSFESQSYQTYEAQSESTEDKITPESSKGPRVIGKKGLYTNPEEDSNKAIPPQTYTLGYSNNSVTNWQRPSDNYIDPYWPGPSHSSKPRKKQAQVQKNKVEKTLNSMLSKPVEMSKGKSLLEKMGWTGGGLGKDGNGIVNPIVPKAAYAVNTLGLGHMSMEPERKQKKPPTKKLFKRTHYFKTNVLSMIVEFVKNDTEVEMLFDSMLYNKERKRIHDLVEALRECTDVDELDYVKPLDVELAREILKYNTYLLKTESYGKHPNRSLRLFKEAPSYVYLITPDDFKDDDYEQFEDFCEPLEIDTQDKTENVIDTFTEKVNLDVERDEIQNNEKDDKDISLNSDIITVPREDITAKKYEANVNKLNVETICDDKKFMEVDSSTNVNCHLDFEQKSKIESLKYSSNNDKTINKVEEVESNDKLTSNSIEHVKNIENETSRNERNVIDSEEKPKKSLLSLIVEYFKEFIIDTSYLEFRFLGPFNNDEVEAINTFFDICLQRDNEDSIEKFEILEVLNSEVYNIEIQETLNGSNVVYKSEKVQ